MPTIPIPATLLRDSKRLFGRLRHTRSKLPVLNCIRVETTPNGVTLAATDLDHWVEFRVSDEPMEPSTFLISAEAMDRACRADRGTAVRFTPSGSCKSRDLELTFTQGGIGVSSIHPAPDAKEFPLRPSVEGPSCVIPPATLENLSHVATCASTDATRHILNGVLFTPEGGGRIVASDGRRLACAPASVPSASFVLPSLAASILGHPGFNADLTTIVWDFSGEPENHRVQFECGSLCLISKTVEGNYPDFQQVIPRDANELAVIPHDRRPGLIAWLRSLGKDQASVRLDWHKRGQLTLTHRDANGHTATMQVPVEIHGNPPVLAFNARYLADALEIGSTLCLGDELTPGICRHPTGRFCVIMPMRLNGAPVARIEHGKAAA